MDLQKPRISKDALEHLANIRKQYITERRPYVDYWKQYAPKVNPTMSDWDEDTAPGQKALPSKKDNYDNSAQKASDIFANGMQSAAFGRTVPWIATRPEDLDLAKDKPAAEWLQQADRAMALDFARTTFYEEGRAFTRSAADFATGIMFRDFNEARAMPIYHTLHLKRTLIAENEFGEVDTLFRDFWLSPFEAARFFGENNLPQAVKEALKEKDTKKRKYLQFIMPKDKYDLDIQARAGKEFYSLYAMEEDGLTAIMEGGYETRPFYVWRWARSLDGDVWGVDSPGMIEYSNILQANSQKKDFARLIQLAARPPIKATEGMQAQGVHIEPNYKHFMRPGDDFAPVPISGPLDGIIASMQDLQKSIRESYYTDFFLTLTANLERVKTATEATYIKGEQAAMLAAMSGRLTVEFLEPAVEDIFALELRYGRLPPIPESLKGKNVRVDLISPLTQLQKRYMMLNETDEFMARILQVAQVDQKIMDKVDLDAYADSIAEAYNQDRRVVRDLVDVQRIRDARDKAQAMAAAQQLKNETTKAQASMLSAGGKAVEPGSPVEAAMKGGQA
ncbi:MAG: head-tail connector protein [Spirochaetes bacterium]|nr:head-tail connector protein [Spirochaetota bacterium]